MFSYKLSNDKLKPILERCIGVINSYCTYDPIWYYNATERTVSKAKTDICVPTSLQVGEIVRAVVSWSTSPLVLYGTFFTQVSFMFPSLDIYQVQLIALSKLLGSFPEKLKQSKKVLAEEDPFKDQTPTQDVLIN